MQIARRVITYRNKATRKNFDWALNLNRLILNGMGVWPSDTEDSISRTLRVPFMGLWILFSLFLPNVYALVLVHRELPLFIDSILPNCGSFICMAKLFFIWYNRRERTANHAIYKIIHILYEICNVYCAIVLESLIKWMAADWSNKTNIWEQTVMIKQARRGRLFTMSGYAAMFANAIFFTVSPFFNVSIRIINNITDLHEKHFFPLQTFYPYDFTKSPTFELTYLAQLIGIGFAGIAFSSADNFFGAPVFHASGQSEILAARMAELLDFLTISAQNLEFQRSKLYLMKFKIQQLVEFHIYLIKFVLAIEKSFNLLILVHALGLTGVMCCVGYGVIQIIKNNLPIVQIFPLATTLMNLLLHMFVYCIATETLTSNSAEIFQEIYNCNWHILPAKCARDIILVMVRSQFPLQLTAGKFFYLSLNTYIQVLKTSAGYISMLLTIS